MERRSKVRYRVSAGAVFAWEGSKGNILQGKGVTRDIGLAGAFVFTPTTPPVNAKIDLEIFLAPTSSVGKNVRIKTEATITRIDHSAASEGFAAVSQDFTLLFDRKGRNEFCVSSFEMALKGTADE
jgi:hypothetical protein